MKTTTFIVPPVLLVKLFGVPECIALPHKIDGTTEFTAHGKQWQVKKLRRGTYFLIETTAGASTRGRFGTATEISDDIGRVLESGALPRSETSVH